MAEDHPTRHRPGESSGGELDAALEAAFGPAPTGDYGPAEGPGTVIGRYKLLQKIGEGGFGAVYMAEQQHPIRRRVALKVIKLGMDTAAVVARFEAERQALAMMDHPNIARVLDAGATDTGRPYFVMELVRGIPLTDYCDRNSLDTPQRLELFARVCSAVQHAHQKGIIHRDLKPSNVMVTLHDGVPVPKVIDFGIAKATQARLTEKTLFTQYGQFIGTPAYMSPEQAEMSGLDVDTRSDIYSLGVLLYELLTGSTPLDQARLRGAGYAEMQRLIREVEPPRPSVRLSESGEALVTICARRHTEPQKLGRLLRGDLDWIVMKALEKDRTRRYETANGFAADVQRFLRNEVVEACPPSRAYRLRKFAHKYRTFLATSALLLTVLLVATGVSAWQALRASFAERRAREEARRAAEAEAEAKGLSRTAIEARHDAERRLHVATALRLAVLAGNTRLPQQNLLLAVEAIQATRSHREPIVPLAHQSLIDALAATGGRGLCGHEGPVYAVAISPDGCRAVTASADHTVRLWDLTAPEPAASALVLRGHEGAVVRVAFSPDGRLLATGSSDNTVRIWDPGAVLPRCLRVLRGHQRAVSEVLFTPDGRRLVTAGWDAALRVWDLGNLGGPPVLLPGLANAGPRAVGLSGDGRWLMAAFGDPFVGSEVRLWDLAAEDPLASLKVLPAPQRPPSSFFLSAALSPDGRWIAAGGDQEILLWQWGPGGAANPPRRLTPGGRTLLFSPDGQWLAAEEGATMRLWPLAARDLDASRVTLKGHTEGILSAGFSADGRWLNTTSRDQTVRLWDLKALADPSPVVLRGHDRMAGASAFGPEGRWLLTGSSDHTARLWDLHRQDPAAAYPSLGRWLDPNRVATNPALSPDGHWLAAARYDSKVAQLWDLSGEGSVRAPRSLRGHESAITALSFSGDGRLVTGDQDGRILLWDLTVPGPDLTPRVIGGHQEQVKAILAGQRGHHLVTIGNAGDARIWDLKAPLNGAPVGAFEDRERLQNISSVRLSPRGGWLAVHQHQVRPPGVLSTSKVVRVWDVRDAEPGSTVADLRGHEDRVLTMALSPDGQRLATGANDRTVRVWQVDAERNAWVARVLPYPGIPTALAFSHDGHHLAAGGTGNTACVWDLRQEPAGTPLVLRGHQHSLSSVAFSPDGRWLATGSHDRTVRLWDLKPGTPEPSYLVLRGHAATIVELRFSAAGGRLVSRSWDGTVRVWELRVEELLRLARRTAGRELTSAERKQNLVPETD